MSVLGESPLMERGGPPPLIPRLWRPALWCPAATCPELPLYPPPRSMTHLLDDYMGSPHLWYPWYFKGESLYKRTSPIDNRESPCKELPTKLLKQERLKDRQELSQTLNFDKDHTAKLNSKKSAGTQTQFTSFNGDGFNCYSNRETITTESYSGHHGFAPPSSQTNAQSPEVEMTSADIQNAPLNLSLSSAGPTQPIRPQPRPSVITCATAALPNSSGGRYGQNVQSAGPDDASSPTRRENTAVVTDPAIEEHFRRSLGKNYADSMSTKTTTTTTTTVKANLSITGSVDDHFAKSLGDTTWTAIKAKADPIKDMFTGSVDDHFAKALGDTWLRIKAEKESSCLSSTRSSPSGSPQHTSVVTT